MTKWSLPGWLQIAWTASAKFMMHWNTRYETEFIARCDFCPKATKNALSELLILLSTNTDGHSQINFHVLEESLSSVTKIGTCKKLWLKSLTNYMDSAGIKPVLQPVNTEILKNAWMPRNACLPGVYIVFRAAILLLVQFFFTSGALSWKAGTAMGWHFLAKHVLLKSSWSAVVSRARLHNWHYLAIKLLKLWTNFHQSGKQGRGPKKISGFP